MPHETYGDGGNKTLVNQDEKEMLDACIGAVERREDPEPLWVADDSHVRRP